MAGPPRDAFAVKWLVQQDLCKRSYGRGERTRIQRVSC